MKGEIKEILDFLKDKRGYYKTLSQDKTDKLLDYITNLQERKITKEDVDKYFEENMCVSFDKFIENWNEQEEWTNYYKEENERLKEIVENLTTMTVCGDRKQIKNTAQYKLDICKSRCEKAIEYMNNYIELEDAPINERIKIEFKEVIKLLNGGDE